MTGGIVVWFTGLPASGKSTLARLVREAIAPRAAVVLDSDELREVLGATGYAREDRDAFYRALGALAALIARQELVVLVAATAPLRRHRQGARALAPAWLEVHVRTPLAVCEQRDGKGLYARARAGDAPHLPGVGAVYEAPEAPEVVADDGRDATAVASIVRRLGAGDASPTGHADHDR